MLDEGIDASEALAACDLLQQAARLSAALASAAVAEGALWRLLAHVYSYESSLKSRLASSQQSNFSSAQRSHGASARRTHLGSELVRADGVGHVTRPQVNWEHVQGGDAGQGTSSHALLGPAEQVQVAVGALAALRVLLAQSEAAPRSFLLLGGVHGAAALLTRLQALVRSCIQRSSKSSSVVASGIVMPRAECAC